MNLVYSNEDNTVVYNVHATKTDKNRGIFITSVYILVTLIHPFQCEKGRTFASILHNMKTFLRECERSYPHCVYQEEQQFFLKISSIIICIFIGLWCAWMFHPYSLFVLVATVYTQRIYCIAIHQARMNANLTSIIHILDYVTHALQHFGQTDGGDATIYNLPSFVPYILVRKRISQLYQQSTLVSFHIRPFLALYITQYTYVQYRRWCEQEGQMDYSSIGRIDLLWWLDQLQCMGGLDPVQCHSFTYCTKHPGFDSHCQHNRWDWRLSIPATGGQGYWDGAGNPGLYNLVVIEMASHCNGS